VISFINNIKKYLFFDIWIINVKNLNKLYSFLISFIRVLVLSFREFFKNNCSLRASALTFYTLLSIVPIFSILFGIAKGFKFETYLEKLIYKYFYAQEEVVDKIILFSNNLLDNTKIGVLAGVSVLILLYSGIKVLNHIEKAFNHIWSVENNRAFARKIIDYLGLFIICPILIILSTSVSIIATVKLSYFIDILFNYFPLFIDFKPVVLFSLKFISLFSIILLLSFVYSYIPNTKVKILPAICGGLVAGILYQILQTTFFVFAMDLTNYSAIYGSMSSLILFLIWLNISWIIILFGAEVTYAIQNVNLFQYEPITKKLSKDSRDIIAIKILLEMLNNKDLKTNPSMISKKLGIPIGIVNKTFNVLKNSELIYQLEDLSFVVSKEQSFYSIKNIISQINKYGTSVKDLNLFDDITTLYEKYQSDFKDVNILKISKNSN